MQPDAVASVIVGYLQVAVSLRSILLGVMPVVGPHLPGVPVAGAPVKLPDPHHHPPDHCASVADRAGGG